MHIDCIKSPVCILCQQTGFNDSQICESCRIGKYPFYLNPPTVPGGSFDPIVNGLGILLSSQTSGPSAASYERAVLAHGSCTFQQVCTQHFLNVVNVASLDGFKFLAFIFISIGDSYLDKETMWLKYFKTFAALFGDHNETHDNHFGTPYKLISVSRVFSVHNYGIGYVKVVSCTY